jgi:pimeloyl-ACP methyl ester carboxylesterase
MSQPMMRRSTGDGVGIALAIWEGKGKTVFCVHGIAANCRTWDTVAKSLAPDHFVLAMDLRGRGLSDKPSSGYSILHHCRDLYNVVEEQNIERTVIIGHSLGAMIGLAFGAQHPERVEHLVLIDGGGILSKEQTEKVFRGIQPTLDRLGKVFSTQEAYLEFMKKNPLLQPWTPALEAYYLYEIEEVGEGVRSRVNPEHIKEEAENLSKVNLAEFYPLIQCPVLILRATEGMLTKNDILLPDEAVEKMLKEIPDARCVNIEGTNHYSIVLQPNTVRDETVKSFLMEER